MITIINRCALIIFCPIAMFAQSKLFTLLPPDSTGVNFVNEIVDDEFINVMNYEYYYNGAGVAVGDINNDGLPDIFFSSNKFDCKLFLNLGKLKFKDITNTAGVNGGIGTYKTGVVMVDINNDGWLDIYVCRSLVKEKSMRSNLLYINNKDNTFTDRAAEYGLADNGFATNAYFGDTDNDGDLDMVLIQHPIDFAETDRIHLSYNKENKLVVVKDTVTEYERTKFYENVNGKYVDKSATAGISGRSFGLSAIVQDFNNDGLADIYQCNDYLEPDNMWINKGRNTFVDEHDKYFRHSSYSCMGSDFADINNDGLSDLITTDMLPETNQRQKQLRRASNYDQFEKQVKYGFGYQYEKNMVQLNNGNGSFSDISYYTGMAYTDWSWAVLIADFDLDGLKDVYVCNGYLRDVTDLDYVKFSMDSVKKTVGKLKTQNDILKLLQVIPSVKVYNSYFKNYGNLAFKKETKESGLDFPSWSFGAAYADLDGDGDLEIIVNNSNDAACIFKNNTIENSTSKSIAITLKGPANNINGYGATLTCTTPDGVTQSLVANTMKGYLSSNDPKLLFGIAAHNQCMVKIHWPDGRIQQANAIAGSTLMFNHADALPNDSLTIVRTLFQDITNQLGVKVKYGENDYIDFKLEPLLPHRFSKMGPCLAVADFNGDKLDDFFMGGAKDFEAQIFLQTPQHAFQLKQNPSLTADKKYEDGAVAAIDFDKDGDMDLVAASGGNDYGYQMAMYPLRFYKNDGKANFTRYDMGININISAAAIAYADYDKDGDMDMFIGARVVPGHYGRVPISFLLTNVEGKFQITDTNASFTKAGMINTALFADMNNDSWPDLVIAGEWMPITIYLNNNGVISTTAVELTGTYGWWNKIIANDLDNDGDLDFVCGNLGLNTRYKASGEKPLTMVVNDFDDNGSTDCIISMYYKDKSYPFAIRDYVLDQMPFLRKKYLRYKPYSTTTIEEMFTPEMLTSSLKYKAETMASCIILNNGTMNFTTRTLPPLAQLFPINTIDVLDANNDGMKDLMLAGNDFSTEVETGRNDAGIGLLLIGNSGLNFSPVSSINSGLLISGHVRSSTSLLVDNNPVLIFGKNGDRLQIITVRH